MTRRDFERLIKAQTEHITVEGLSLGTLKMADAMARDICVSEAFRAELRAIVRKHFTRRWARLATNGTRPRRKQR